MAVSRRLRFEILRRDRFRCVYCLQRTSKLEVDHIHPRSLGGKDVASNLVTACAACNGRKSAHLLSAPLVDRPSDEAMLLFDIATSGLMGGIEYLLDEEGASFDEIRQALIYPTTERHCWLLTTLVDCVNGWNCTRRRRAAEAAS